MFLNKIINCINSLWNISHIVKVKINNYITFILDNTFINTYVNSVKYNNCIKKKIKIGLLTNEIPPIIYGGVATWIVNFIKMFNNEENIEIIPIFLAYQDDLPENCKKEYKNIRIIENDNDIPLHFKDIDICINNLWICCDVIKKIKELYPNLSMVTVCHSLIQMENITNLGSIYTNNWCDQEATFKISDYVILISNAEQNYYNTFGYDLFKTKTKVIYNSYSPKYDNNVLNNNYMCDDIGYIGRHVPRKRPEIPILAVESLKLKNIKVHNMGVDYDKYGNEFWKLLEKQYTDNLNVIPFTSDKSKKEKFFEETGWCCITGIYEPFGYTICEAIDRCKPLIVGNIDGPKEIINEVKEHVITYEVDIDNYENDIKNFSKALQKALKLTPEEREKNAIKVRKCLDTFRPETIKLDWIELFNEILHL
tara:strand:+ start:364 stop:1635 length:1272 start_codon:yes stop_codon:yes gene_type:complete